MKLSRRGIIEKFARNAQQTTNPSPVQTAQPSLRRNQFRTTSLTASQNTRNRVASTNSQQVDGTAHGSVQLDPRELYRVKNQHIMMRTQQNTIDQGSFSVTVTSKQGGFFGRRNPGTRTNNVFKPYTSVHSQKSPRFVTQDIGDHQTSQESSQHHRRVASLQNRLPGRVSLSSKLNQTLMSFQNRKAQQLPNVYIQQDLPHSQHMFNRCQKHAAEFDEASQSFDSSPYHSKVSPAHKSRNVTTRVLKPLSNDITTLRDSKGFDQRKSIVNQSISSPEMPRSVPMKSDKMNLTAINFSDSANKVATKHHRLTNVAASPNRDYLDDYKINQHGPSYHTTRHLTQQLAGQNPAREVLPMTTKSLGTAASPIEGIMQRQGPPKSPELKATKANMQMAIDTDYNSALIKIGPLITNLKNVISEEKNSALFNPDSEMVLKTSSSGTRNNFRQIASQQVTDPRSTGQLKMAAEMVQQQRFETLEDSVPKRMQHSMLDNFKGAAANPKRCVKKSTMDIKNTVPIAIAKKSSRADVSRKPSGKLPLQSSNSFVSMTSRQKQNKKQQLASFNDDLKEVVGSGDYKNGMRKSSERNLVGKRNDDQSSSKSKRSSSQKQALPDLVLDAYDIMSKETLKQSKQEGADLLNASVETFNNQKMKASRPPRLEIAYKQRAVNISKISPQSQENTPIKTPHTPLKQLGVPQNDQQCRNSSITLTISQHGDLPAEEHVIMPLVPKQRSQNQPRKMMTTHQVDKFDAASPQNMSPLIIQSNNLEARNNKRKPYERVKQTLVERTLDKIANLKDNKSIVIDINALDPQNKTSRLSHPMKVVDPDKTSRSANTQSAISQRLTPISQKGDKAQGQKKLQNPLVLSKYVPQSTLEPERKTSNQLRKDGHLDTVMASLDADDGAEPNQDIKAVVEPSGAFNRPRESSIGVGSVVLHLRKNKNAVNNPGEEEIMQQIPTHDSNGSGDGYDTMDSGENGTIFHIGSTIANKINDVPGLFQKSSPRGNLSKDLSTVNNSPRGEQNSFRRMPVQGKSCQPIKNGQVLKQQAFSNMVRANKPKPVSKVEWQPSSITQPTTVKLGSPRTQNKAPRASQRRERRPKPSSKKPQNLQLIGTQKEQVEQPVRLPNKYIKSRRHHRTHTQNAKATTFMVPNYFEDRPVNLNIVQDRLGETLNGQPAQMHQLITLENGQMMIRRIDVTQVAEDDQHNINVQNVATHGQWQQINTGQLQQPVSPANRFHYTPLTSNRPDITASPSNSPAQNMTTSAVHHTPSKFEVMSGDRDGGIVARRQYLELSQQIQQHHHQGREEQSVQAIETVCGTEKSLTSLQQPSLHVVNAAMDQSQESARQHYKTNPPTGFVSQNSHYIQKALDNQKLVVGSESIRPRKMTQQIANEHHESLRTNEFLVTGDSQPEISSLNSPVEFKFQNKFKKGGDPLDHASKNLAIDENADVMSAVNNTKSDGAGDCQASYNYLQAAGHFLQPTDERTSEHDVSTMQPASNQNQEVVGAPNKRPFIKPLDISKLEVISGEKQISPRKMVIFQQSPTILVNQSVVTHESDDQQINGIQTAKLMQMASVSAMATSEEQQCQKPALIKVDALSHQSNAIDDQTNLILNLHEEDPVLKKKKIQKKQTQQLETPSDKKYSEHNDFLGSFKPWQDNEITTTKRKKTALASQSQDPTKTGTHNISVNKSNDGSRISQKRINGLNSSKQSFDNNNGSVLRSNSKVQPSPTIYLEKNQSYQLRSKRKIIVQDKVQQSFRQQQEKQMRDIVFDDDKSPCFRPLNAQDNEEKSFEEAAQRSTIILAEDCGGTVSPDWDGANDDQQLASMGQFQPLLTPIAKVESPADAQKAKDKDDNLMGQVYNAVLQDQATEFKALRTSDIKLKKKPSFEETQEEEKPYNKYAVSKPVEFDATATFGAGMIKRKGQQPEGEEINYIIDDRMDSYYKR